MPLYHVASVPLAPNSQILPGNWGRILRKYTVGSADLTNLLRETILEHIRRDEFPGKPSRLDAAFALPTLEAAGFYQAHNQPLGIVYEVEFVVPDRPRHEGDFNLIQPKPGEQWLSEMERLARCYWRGERSTVVDTMGQPIQTDCREIVICSPLRILRAVEGA